MAEQSVFLYEAETAARRRQRQREGGITWQILRSRWFSYFGAGVVGSVRTSTQDATRPECEIVDYRPFERVIPFRDAGGAYAEVNGSRKGYYQRGVRRVTDSELESILELAEMAAPEAEVVAGEVPPVEAKYGTSEASRLVEEYAVKQVIALLRERHGQRNVVEMPRNDPGYDVKVLFDGRLYRYVEVKGTSLPAALFFLTEGERKFSAAEVPPLRALRGLQRSARWGNARHRPMGRRSHRRGVQPHHVPMARASPRVEGWPPRLVALRPKLDRIVSVALSA